MGWDVSPIRLLLSKDEKTTGGQEEEGGVNAIWTRQKNLKSHTFRERQCREHSTRNN